MLRFNPKTAAGIMSLDYVKVSADTTFEELSSKLKKHEVSTGKFPAILVFANDILVGEVPGHIIIGKEKSDEVFNYVKPLPQIGYAESQGHVLKTFKENRHDKVCVVDEEGQVLGIIYSDDLLNIVETKNVESVYGFAGIDKEDSIHDSIFSKVKNRYFWLVINLATAFLAASVIAVFQDTITSFVLLAVYMPIIAGMGGNAATQTFAVMVRAISLKEIGLKNSKKEIFKEMSAGLINGFIISLLLGIVSWIFGHSLIFALIASIAMILNLVVAGLFGAITPLILDRLGKDPATSS